MNTALIAARARHQGAIETDYGSRVTLAGIVYDCAAVLEAARWVMNESSGNWEQKQTLKISIRKSLLVVPPARKAVVLHEGVRFSVDGEVGGQNEIDQAWQITASRKLPAPPAGAGA